MPKHRTLLRLAILTALLSLPAGCASTRTDDHGVTVEKHRSYNPLDYIPGF